MTQIDSSTKTRFPGAEFWMGAGLILMALAFCLFAFFTHELLPTKGSFGELRNLHNVVGHLTAHPARTALIPLFALLSLFCVVIASLRSETGRWARFLAGRAGASILLLSVGFCQLPLYFTRGVMDNNDPLGIINALAEASANYRIGQWPFYTFHFSNGTTLGLQYPMLRTLWGGMFDAVSPFDTQLNFQILCAAIHLFMLTGIYRLLRAWRFSRLACVIPALTLVGCHRDAALLSFRFVCHIRFQRLRRLVFSSSRPLVLIAQAQERARGRLLVRLHRPGASCRRPVHRVFPYSANSLRHRQKSTGRARRFLVTGCGFSLLSVLVALPYLVSVLAFSHFNAYRPGAVTAFQDSATRLAENFKWIVKYAGAQSGESERGEYISVILAALIFAGLFKALSHRLAGKGREFGPRYFALLALWMFCGGGLLFYGRDTALMSAIPGVKLLKVNNRSFIFFAMGLAMLAGKPIDGLLRKNHFYWVLCLGALLFIEQSPYWLRPTYFSLPDNQRIYASEFKDYNHRTASFLVIRPAGRRRSRLLGGCAFPSKRLFRYQSHRRRGAVHYRYRVQGFPRPPDWNQIARRCRADHRHSEMAPRHRRDLEER